MKCFRLNKWMLITSIIILQNLNLSATNYYIDSQKGNDNNAGNTPRKAWRSLEKANELKLDPGDSLFFKRNSVFEGQLKLNLEGLFDKLIYVGAYDKGNKPIFNGNGEMDYTLLLENSAYCWVENLELTNTGAQREAKRVGLLIRAENSGERRDIVVCGLTIRDVNGSLVKKEGGGGGILWENKGEQIKTRYIGLKILDCHIINCGRNGIYSNGYSGRDNWFPNLNVLIKGNLLEKVPGDGIVPIGCDGAIIEYNVMHDCPDILSHDEAAAGIWPWSCDNTTIQYNEVSGHNAKWDGQGFDSDYNCRNTIIQYNYSHDNAGGFLLVCNDGGSLGKNWNNGTDNTIIRYNISINDGLRAYPTKQASWFSPVVHITGPVTNTQFYGNLIWVKKKGQENIDTRIVKMDDWGEKWPDNTAFYNNIFYVEDDAQASFAFGNDTSTRFSENTYAGNIKNIPIDIRARDINSLNLDKVLKANTIKDKITALQALNQYVVPKYESFHPGKLWKDNYNKHINAHGGGIIYHDERYYWFGEFKGYDTNSAMVGVTCYSSSDLYNWRDEGVALRVTDDAKSPIVNGCIIERPKVIYNEKNRKFVMYFHLEMKGHGYEKAHVGIAISDNISGPYTFLKSYRPNAGFWPSNLNQEQCTLKVKTYDFQDWWTPQWRKDVDEGLLVRRDFLGGQMSRDMTLFVDDDGKAYHIYSSEENLTLHLSELSDDYQSHTGKYIRIQPGGHNEAPAIFKKDGHYFMITSGCTGWAPNTARLLVADNIWGPWKLHSNPCVGEDSNLTFHSQSTYILPVVGKKDAFIFMGDRWTPDRPIDGRYIWLPIIFENGLPVLKWKDEWTLDEGFVGSLDQVEDSYKLSGHKLADLAEKILYKKTAQEDLYLYLLRPQKKTEELLPAIVYFTGGGWVHGDVYGQIRNPAWFRDQGIIGIEADYRVESRHGTSPLTCIEDGKTAIRYIREHAEELGIDPNRIIAAGGSAGGHIAICTFLEGGDGEGENLAISTKPNALVLHNPVLGEGFGNEFFTTYPAFSPILQIGSGWVPTILSNGTKDSITPYSAAVKFTNLMKDAGNVCKLISVEGAEHSCDWPVENPNFLPNMNQMYQFLKTENIIK